MYEKKLRNALVEKRRSPLDDVETVSAKDGRLWTQSGKDDVEECLPAGGDTFFLKNGDLGSVTFVRDVQGDGLHLSPPGRTGNPRQEGEVIGPGVGG